MALAVRSTKARLACYDDFVAVHHHEKAHAGSPIIGPHSLFLTALREFETRLLLCRPKGGSRVETRSIGGTALVTKRINRIDVSRRVRWFLANGLIALGWGLCAHRLFTSARWLVPEARRFYIQRTIPHNLIGVGAAS